MKNLARITLPALLVVGLIPAGLAAQSDDKTGKVVDTSRDARKNGPTADDQKNNHTDRTLTAEIRKAVVGDKSLSTAAHNVKIITRNGEVTLRGRVQSEDERKAVVSKAEEIAGKGKVTDQLQMTTGVSSREKNPDK